MVACCSVSAVTCGNVVAKCCQISDEAMTIIGELGNFHWFCQPRKIEAFKVINKSAKTADSIAPNDSMTTSQVCQQATQAISKAIKSLEIVVTEVKEKIDITYQNFCKINNVFMQAIIIFNYYF